MLQRTLLIVLFIAGPQNVHADEPSRQQVIDALHKATRYFHGTIADNGGYAWTSSVDGKNRQGEGIAPPGTIWVQPPGTPSVGLAFLELFESTQDKIHLTAAHDTAMALVNGQLRSGGWNYRIEFDPKKRTEFIYRDSPQGSDVIETPFPGGWDVWKQRKYKTDITILDDDTTASVLRFLMRMDQHYQFKNKAIHDATDYALRSTMNAQYPIGAWSHNYDRFQKEPPLEKHYPIKSASYPEKWSRTWTKDFTGCYMLNDRITQNMIKTMLLANSIYADKRYLTSAERGGKFLLLAQMPEPQPAWAQEYNRDMQPVWDRKFEPPAITGLESQDVLDTLLTLYRETGNKEYLKPFATALPYLKKCQLPTNMIARFYELQTNKPIYFTKDYRLVYDADDVPEHYGFAFHSRLDSIEKQYQRARDLTIDEFRKVPASRRTPEMIETVRKILTVQNDKGGWPEPGSVRDASGKKLTPSEGVIQSQTFILNTTILREYLRTTP